LARIKFQDITSTTGVEVKEEKDLGMITQDLNSQGFSAVSAGMT